MANFVTKKDGTRVPFEPEKIKKGILAASSEAGLSSQAAEEVTMGILSSVDTAFEGQEEVSSSEVRDKILSELDESQPSVAESWRRYEEGKGQ